MIRGGSKGSGKNIEYVLSGTGLSELACKGPFIAQLPCRLFNDF